MSHGCGYEWNNDRGKIRRHPCTMPQYHALPEMIGEYGTVDAGHQRKQTWSPRQRPPAITNCTQFKATQSHR